MPIDLLGLLRGKDVLLGAIDIASKPVETPEQVAGTIEAGVELCPSGAALSLNQLRHGADGSVARDQQTRRTQPRYRARPRAVRIIVSSALDHDPMRYAWRETHWREN